MCVTLEYECQRREDIRLSRTEWSEIQTEKAIIYLSQVKYWNKDIGLYVQLVA